MNIIVCVKQVAEGSDVGIDKKTNTINRSGAKGIINPFDMYAIEEALRLREQFDGTVTVLSMGIPSAAETLKEAIAMGADNAILLSDRVFAGADTLATAYSLSKAVAKIGDYDLVICGRQSTDGDTAQVGPALAEKLGVPHATCVSKVDSISGGHIKCHKLADDWYEIVDLVLPAVITVVKEINDPRLPTIRGVLKAKKAKVEIWNSEDVGADKGACGLAGSPTRVVKTETPVHDTVSEIIEGNSPDEKAEFLLKKIDLSMR